MKKILKNFTNLLCFLTSIPIPRSLCTSIELGSLYLTTLIGFLKGFIIASLVILIAPYISIYVITSVTLALHFILQGFLHADGFIDFSEALLAHRFGVDPYKVVKDRYRGSYAIAVFTVFTIFLYTALLIVVSRGVLYLIFGEVWSSSSMLLITFIGSTPPEGFGAKFKKSLRLGDVALSIVIAFAITLGIIAYVEHLFKAFAIAFLSLASTLISVAVSYTLSSRTLGFVNGDVIGFTAELTYALTMLMYSLGVKL